MTNKPALLGGVPVIQKTFPPYNTIDENEKRAVLEVLDSGLLSNFYGSPGKRFFGGEKVQQLEQDWQNYFKVKHAVAMNSATSALIAAVTACGIGVGDEVIVAPLTMSATGSAVLLNGAVPVFADVDPVTMNICPKAIEEKITPRTKAIYVVHLGGYGADMDPIMRLAKKYELFVLGDNAQSPGALYKNQFVGCIEDIGVFSLNCHKTIQSGEGGIAVTNDDDLALKLQLVRNHGEKCTVGFGKPDWHIVGQNYRMTEMEAAVGIEQLKKLKGLNQHRQDLAHYLTQEIQKRFDFLQTPPLCTKDTTHVYYIYMLKYQTDKTDLPFDLFSKALTAEGVPHVPKWAVPIYQLSIYQDKATQWGQGFPFSPPWHNGSVSYAKGICPEAEKWQEHSLCLDTLVRWPNTTEDMDLILQAIEKVIDHKEELLTHEKR